MQTPNYLSLRETIQIELNTLIEVQKGLRPAVNGVRSRYMKASRDQ